MLRFNIEQNLGMSSEQFSASFVNNALYPNQITPPNSIPSWPEPFGAILQPQSVSGQLPLFANNLLLANVSILADEASRNANPFVTSINGFLTNSAVDSWQFNLLSRDNSPVVEIDPVRQNIATSLQQSSQLELPVINSGLAQTIDLAQQQIASFFQQPDVASQLALAFGQGVDSELVKSFSLQLPTIEVVPDSLLGKANGAYATSNNTIFLAHSLIARGDRQEIVAVLIEEIGHSIDAHVNSKDSAGDEGEIFAKLVSGHLNQADYLVILAEDDSNQILWHGQALAVENAAPDNFTIRAAGTVEIKGNSDLDGNPLILQDDALIYAGQGFSIKGNTILPVKRDINGNPLRDSKGKLILVDRAVAVSSTYSLSETNSKDYGNLVPPQVVAKQQIDIPSYSSLEQQYLTSKITTSNPQTTFNVANSNISTTARWQQNFPTGGTITLPRVITVTGGDLNIPTGITLSNCIIIVQNGDIDLQNGNQQFDNVTLVTKNGDILLGNVRSKNLTVLSAGEVSTASNSRFDGNTLLTSKNGDISFRGATTNLNASQNLQVIAHGEIDYRSDVATRGQFLSTGDFVANGNTNLYGTISSQQSVFLNGNTTITAVSTADVTPPSITVTLIDDTGSNTTDRLTKDAGIKGQVTDTSGIAEFKVQLDGNATAIDLKSKLQADGTFNLTDAQVRQLVGNLPDGLHSLAFTSKDTAGNQSNFSLSFTLDTAAPLFTLTPLSIIKNDGKLVGQLTDSNLDQLSYQWDSGTAKAIGLTNGSYNQALDFTGISNGAHTLTITAIDKAGNLTVTPYNVTVAVDKTAPVISAKLAIDSGINSTDGITNNAAITGTITDDNTIATLQASFDGINFVNVTPGANGSISISATQLATIKGSVLTDGAYNLRFQAQDQFGNVSSLYIVSFTLDTTAAVPSQLTLAATSDSGVSATDGITKVKNPQITGTGEAGSTVSLFDGTQQVGQTTVGTNGTWQITTAPNLTDGQHQLTAKQTDLAGNVSSASSPLAITIDSTAPQLTLTAPDIIKNDGKLVGQILDSNLDRLTYQWDSGAAKSIVLSNGNFNQALDFAGIANGAHSLTLTAVDKAGNITVTPYNITVARDLAAPIINAKLAIDSGISSIDGITNSAAITGTVIDDSIVDALQASFDGINFVDILPQRTTNGSISITAAQLATIKGSALTDGVYNLKIKAQDRYGNASPIFSVGFTLDTIAATPGQLSLAATSDSGSSNSDKITNVKTPKITGTGEAGNILTLLDGTQQVGQTTVSADGTWQITTAVNLVDGQHQLTAKMTDIAGNPGPLSPALALTIDSLAPQFTLGQPLDNTVLNNNSRLQGTTTDSQIVTASYSFAGGQTVVLPIDANGNFDAPFDFTGIADGSHQLTLTFTDVAGNSVNRIYAINLSRGPLLTVALLNDTGASNSDGITTDVTIRGQVADRTQISRLEIALDSTTNYADYTFALQNDGSFQLSALQVNSLAGGQLATGAHSLNVRTVLANGVAVATSQLSFTLQAIDTTNSIQLALATSNDSGPIGDGVTDAAIVNLIAKAAPGSTLTLVGLNKTGVADASGQVVFENINLALGANNFTVTKDGLQQQFSFQRVAPNNVVLEWNAIALDVMQRDPYTPPPMFSRNLAMVQAAVYDAVNAISQRYSVYKVDINAVAGTSEEAAAASAAARILSKLYPSQQALFNAALTRTLSTITDGAGKTAGIELGNAVADQIFALRSKDGVKTQVPYQNSNEIGKWQPSLPNFGGALYPQWPQVTPFALVSGSQFRPNGLPSLNSAEYTAAFNEVSQLGARNSTVRTADQTQIAQFWSDGSGTYTPVGHWNQIAGTVASVKGTSIIETARLFAQLDVALADAGIAAWDAKYTYNTWRPITAIRDAALDGNANTTADPNWQPLIDTPPFPEYVSGHSTFSAAAAAVLGKTFGDSFQFQSGSVTLPGTSRSFTSFTDAAAEAGQSRIYGGIHFQFSNRDGLTLGKSIGDYVADRFLIDETKGAIGVKLSLDTAAFGIINRDRVTRAADLTGVVRLDQPGLRLQIAQVGGAFTDVVVNADKTFNLSASQLATAIGTLTDKTYQLTLRLLDGSNTVVGSNNFSFTLDTTAPVIQIGDLTGASPLAHLVGSTDIGGAGRFKVDGGAWNSFALQPDGKFDPVISGAGLSAGLHQVEVQIADAADNLASQIVNVTIDGNGGFYSSPATNAGWGQILTNGFALYEGNSLVTEKSIDVTFGGAGQRVLEFDLQTSFDGSDTRSFAHDRVAFYLVDANGAPLSIDGQRPGSLPVFAYGESGTDTIPGLVQFDGTHVKIDVSGVDATAGRLVVQLLNQDGDSRGNVKVTNFVDRLDPQGTFGQAVSPYVAPVNPGTGVVLDGYLGTTSGQLLLSDVSFDRNTGKYSADLRVKNVGSTVLSRNLAVLLSELPAGVTVANASGIHAAGSAYLNFATAIQAGGLAAGAISGAIRVEIGDPNLKAFGFKPVVLQGAAEPIPDLSTLRNLTVKVGDKLDLALDPNLALSIAATGNLPTGSITGDSHLVFNPAPNQVGTYEFTLIAQNGSTETRQAVTLNVVADPITTTRVTGIIANTNQAGIAGVLVEFAGQQATTDSAGKFVIVVPNGAAGDTLKIYGQRIQGGSVTYPFIAEKMPLLLGHDLYQGVNNGIDRPIYLPTIDLSTGTTVNPNAQTVASNPNLPNARVTVAANSLYDKNGNAFTGILSITEVPTNLTPAALPPNLHPDLVVTIQPGDMVFNTPAKLTLPNKAGYQPGLIMDLWSINPNTGLFDIVGKGQVSADGSVIETIEGGIRNSSWHLFAPPPVINLNLSNNNEQKKVCQVCEDTQSYKSEVSSQTGAVLDDRSLVSYQSQGISRAIELHYDSQRANPTKVFRINGNVDYAVFGEDYVTGKVTVTANGISQVIPGLNSSQAQGITGGERVWALSGSSIDTAIYGSLSSLNSGVYDTQLDVGVRGRRINPNTSLLELVGTTESKNDKLIVVNDSNSVFGGGWNVSGLQKLVINQDNSALLIDGGGSQWLFNASGNTYQSPAGDFSKLERLLDGTWQRTTKDGTRYQFNAKGLMVAATDKQGNTTRHIYNGVGQIQQIVDPVGLITTFNYAGNRVTSIVDPAGRNTVLSYDSQGNLLSITDPDGTKNQYGYDNHHLLSSSIDKTGQIRTGVYDEFGRAKTATREDGSTVQIKPLEVQGLLNQQQTTNLNLIAAAPLSASLSSTYVDGNGQIKETLLNQRGQVTNRTDGGGFESSKTYNSDFLVSSKTDGNGHTVNYQYDLKGNIIKIEEEINSPPTYNITGNTFSPTSAIRTIDKPGIAAEDLFVTGDINNDGFADIITTSTSNRLNVLLGDSSGGFSRKYDVPSGTFYSSNNINQLDLKDVNNDGYLDLLANLPSDNGGGGVPIAPPGGFFGLADPVLVYLNQGNGQFATAQPLIFQATSDGFVTGDFNNDGKIDILARMDIYTASNTNTYPVVLYAGNGQGSFTQSSITISGIDNNSSFTGGGAQTFALDIDGDGRKELVFNLYDRLSVFKYNVSTSTWSSSNNYTLDFYSSRTKAVTGDLNGDGFGDLVTIGDSQVNLLLGQANGSFSSQTSNIDSSLQLIDYSKIADFNADGQTDLILAGVDSAGKLVAKVYNLSSNGSLQQTGNSLSVGQPSGATYKFVDTADVDGDGDLDLILKSGAGYGTSNEIAIIDNQSIVISPAQNNIATKQYTYDAVFNQLTSVTDELGRKTIYDLDANTGKVLKSTRVVSQLDVISNESNDIVTSYTYTSTGQTDLITDALGHITDYDYDSQGNLVKTISAKGTLDQSIEQYEYDLAGNKTATIDALGHRTTYIYNSTNMLLRSIDPLGGTTTFNYDRMGHQTSVTDALGHVTKMTYDVRGRLASTIDANGSVSTNAYDNNGNLLSVTDPLRRTTKYQYDGRNRLIGTIDANGGATSTRYDQNDNVISSTDKLGHKTQRFYDSRDRLVREVDALGNETKYRYDASNQMIASIDALGHVTTYQYDELGRRVEVIDALGHITKTEYDKLDNVIATIDANGNRTEYKYDSLNRQIEVKDAQAGLTKTGYDKVGNVRSVTDALNHATTFDYDALNRQTITTNALGQSNTSAFDAMGNLIGITDALGRKNFYTYDNLNRRVTSTDALNQVQSVAYDAVGNMVSTTNELGQVTVYTYDSLNRRIKMIDALGHNQTTTYDAEGNVRSTSDAVNNTTHYDYDALNRQVKVIDANIGITSTNYDAVGNLAKITDSVGNSTTYSYDAVNRLLMDTNQLGFSRRYGYDAVGNQVEMIDRNNRKTTYDYDSLNRRTGENWIGVGGVSLRAIGYTYDAVGNMITANDPDAKYTYSYDALNRLSTLDNTGTSGVPTVVLTYAYDVVGNMVSVLDRINGSNAGQTEYTFDQLNRVTKITQSGTGVQRKRVDMTYNKVNQMTGLSRFSDLGDQSLVAETSYTYDQNQRLIQLAHKKGINNLSSYDYTFDAANKLTKIVSSIDGTVDYAYDSTNQLTGVDHGSQTDEAYQYDPNGNRTSAGYQMGTNNQLLADGKYTYQYDGEGNRTQRTEVATGKVTEYLWDYHNRLTGVLFKNSAGVVEKNVEYVYDTNNLRIGKKIDGLVTERFVIDRNQIALVFDDSGVQKSRYLYGTQIDQVLTEESGAQVHWFLTDHQGTVKDVVDNAGTVIDHITYDSFGRIVGQTSPMELRFAYTGREWDGETGQYYYRARYYDAVVGRFISEDPIGFEAKDKNLSRYIENNVVNAVDPSGEVRIMLYMNGVNRLGSHSYIVVYETTPEGIVSGTTPFYYRGGPSKQRNPLQYAFLGGGKVKAEVGFYTPNSQDWPKSGKSAFSQVIYDNPCELSFRYNEALRKSMDRINSAGFPYRIAGPNSNSVIRQMLRDIGFDFPINDGNFITRNLSSPQGVNGVNVAGWDNLLFNSPIGIYKPSDATIFDHPNCRNKCNQK
jgi:RHS repeat-associated protein